jgi:hypothetical protein
METFELTATSKRRASAGSRDACFATIHELARLGDIAAIAYLSSPLRDVRPTSLKDWERMPLFVMEALVYEKTRGVWTVKTLSEPMRLALMATDAVMPASELPVAFDGKHAFPTRTAAVAFATAQQLVKAHKRACPPRPQPAKKSHKKKLPTTAAATTATSATPATTTALQVEAYLAKYGKHRETVGAVTALPQAARQRVRLHVLQEFTQHRVCVTDEGTLSLLTPPRRARPSRSVCAKALAAFCVPPSGTAPAAQAVHPPCAAPTEQCRPIKHPRHPTRPSDAASDSDDAFVPHRARKQTQRAEPLRMQLRTELVATEKAQEGCAWDAIDADLVPPTETAHPCTSAPTAAAIERARKSHDERQKAALAAARTAADALALRSRARESSDVTENSNISVPARREKRARSNSNWKGYALELVGPGSFDTEFAQLPSKPRKARKSHKAQKPHDSETTHAAEDPTVAVDSSPDCAASDAPVDVPMTTSSAAYEAACTESTTHHLWRFESVFDDAAVAAVELDLDTPLQETSDLRALNKSHDSFALHSLGCLHPRAAAAHEEFQSSWSPHTDTSFLAAFFDPMDESV